MAVAHPPGAVVVPASVSLNPIPNPLPNALRDHLRASANKCNSCGLVLAQPQGSRHPQPNLYQITGTNVYGHITCLNGVPPVVPGAVPAPVPLPAMTWRERLVDGVRNVVSGVAEGIATNRVKSALIALGCAGAAALAIKLVDDSYGLLSHTVCLQDNVTEEIWCGAKNAAQHISEVVFEKYKTIEVLAHSGVVAVTRAYEQFQGGSLAVLPNSEVWGYFAENPLKKWFGY